MRLTKVLRVWRRASDQDLRETAKMFGISSATLCRLEKRGSMDGKTLAKILIWLLGEDK
jgi:hypothetical protein